MTIRQRLLAPQYQSAERRAEAAAALARSYLHGALGPDAAWETKTTLLALLDDPSDQVRRALAEACAGAETAPRPLIVALASDQPDIACLVLARSPVLMDADLVDCAAMGCETIRSAIAGRGDLSKPVAAALAEVAGLESLTVLARNHAAEIGTAALLRIVERHGADAGLREALLARPDLPIEVRHAVAVRVADSLSAYGRECGWLSPERSARVTREARDRAALALGDETGESGLARLVAHLRKEGQLTAGLILRAMLSLRMPFAEAALAELSGLSRARVAGLLLEPRSGGFASLHRKAGLPPILLGPIQAALEAWRAAATGQEACEGARLARRMIERALSACEALPFAEARSLLALLARFEAEAARDEAREQSPLPTAAGQDGAEEPLALGAPEAGAPVVLSADRTEAADGPWPAAPRPSDRILPVAGEVIDLRFDAILDELPEAIVASYQAEQQRRSAAATQRVLDDLSGALMESFMASRNAAVAVSAEPVTASVVLEIVPEVVPEPPRARPRAVALALAASMIPEELVRSYAEGRSRLAA
ncbi:DUF2336 domain-containing protein [Methylobacterium organophilum]|uniref:DUF2336 domain-containing protein n=1 Tax=Methylobacterium organophilum TaxID=410 RepID=UPI001F13E377|nr:DUF2336 domain-containing protein [Methylobacterium organophilum]UMY17256.1 DUF2336 domain-containing protein [Methylobacterium organophilum]